MKTQEELKELAARILAAEGMDLVLLEGERIRHNEVWFDRAALAPLLAAA